MNVVDYIKGAIDPRAYYTATLSDIDWPASGAEGRALCPFHKENTPSLSINPDSGKFFCHGCERGGKSIISFHAALHKMGVKDAAADMYHRFVHPVIPDKTVRRWRRNLLGCPSALKYIKSRHIPPSIIKKYELGFNNERIVFPIRNEYGLCVNAKFYSPLASKDKSVPKMQNYRLSPEVEPRPYGSPTMLFPLSSLEQAHRESYVCICEGEWDALLLLSLGIPALTATNGCKSWPGQFTELFRGLEVYTAYDNDKDGEKYDKRPIKSLRNVVRSISRVVIPKLPLGGGKTTKDVSDLYKIDERFQKKASWLRLFKKSKLVLENDPEVIAAVETTAVALDQAADAKYFRKRIQVDGLITGKASSPYLVPYRARISCSKQCDTCPMQESTNDFIEIKVDPSDPSVLGMVDVAKNVVSKHLLNMANMPFSQMCQHKVEIVQGSNLEQVFLIPTLDNKDSQYCIRNAYYVGHGLRSNRAYRFEGVTTPHPEDQTTTHLFDKAVPVQDQVETFELSRADAKKLVLFRPRNLSLMAHLMSMAEWQSRNITKITERQDLHIAVDLAYHSVREFDFNDEHVHRGMLDILIVGDTRCGKGYVAERLMGHYRLGEIASAEMCTFAGLFGGVQSIGKRWVVTWGLIPLNHNRLVIVDEMSSLKEEEISKMSRVRSEGVAEINKIVRESTQANARLIWMSNSRSGREMRDHNTGVQVIKELIGANEDIARFDFALSIASNEVDSALINQRAKPSTDSSLYPADLCRTLVMWAWSRNRNQIKFTSKATDEIISTAIAFGKRYSSKVPLVQGENIRIKLAKISAAIAARVFSSSEDFQSIVVKESHVKCAAQFLKWIYAKPSMGYDVFSTAAISTSTLEEKAPIKRLFDTLGTTRADVINGLIELHRITPDMLADYVGDTQAAKGFIGDLVKLHCLGRIESGGWYLKNPSFTSWLRANRKGTNGQAD